MKKFLNKDFLLDSSVAQELYHEVAAGLPIVDFHNHLDPSSLAENSIPDTIGDLWVVADPYKHRAMRINGIPEYYISGNASPKEKFIHWAETLPKTVGNPLFHWSCAELKNIFGIDEILNESNAEEIWSTCNDIIRERKLGLCNILQHWNTSIVCTSDDLLEDLSKHVLATKNGFNIRVLPSLRGDSIITLDAPGFFPWLNKLQDDLGAIKNLDDYLNAIVVRLNILSASGCRLADHSLDAGFIFIDADEGNASKIFKKYLKKRQITKDEQLNIRSFLLFFLGKEYHKRNWTLQLHIGARRKTSTRLRNMAGAAGGYASIGESCNVESLCNFFDKLERSAGLPNLILYTLNPSDNAVLATLTGSFAEDNVTGKIQFGPAWWYNDSHEGITQQLLSLSNYGLLSHFIGMTTDSRSALSFSRHDYFRRILCNLLGTWVEKGLIPYEQELLYQLVKDISYNNSKKMIDC